MKTKIKLLSLLALVLTVSLTSSYVKADELYAQASDDEAVMEEDDSSSAAGSSEQVYVPSDESSEEGSYDE